MGRMTIPGKPRSDDGWFVVLVEHHDVLRSILHQALETAGFEVRGSTSDARQVSSHLPIVRSARKLLGLVILDQDQPGVDVLGLCQELRERYPLLTLYLTSSSGHPATRAAAFDAGADAHFTQPLDLEEFLASIRRSQARGAATRAWNDSTAAPLTA